MNFPESNKSWWEDGDRVAGMAATILMIGAAGCVVIFLFFATIWLGIKLL